MAQTANSIKQKALSRLDNLAEDLKTLSQQGWDDFMFSRLFPSRAAEVSQQEWEEYEDLEDPDYLRQIGTGYWCHREITDFSHLAEDLRELKKSHWWSEIIKAVPSATKCITSIIQSLQALDNYARASAKMSALTDDPKWSMLSTELSDPHPELTDSFSICDLAKMTEVYSDLGKIIQTI